MFWWVVLALVVFALALLWYRGRTRAGGSSSLDQAALTRARRDRKLRGFSGDGGGLGA